jgi:hypothetical protein
MDMHDTLENFIGTVGSLMSEIMPEWRTASPDERDQVFNRVIEHLRPMPEETYEQYAEIAGRLVAASVGAGDEGGRAVQLPAAVATQLKYTCPLCGYSVWGGPRLSIVCGDCGMPFARRH